MRAGLNRGVGARSERGSARDGSVVEDETVDGALAIVVELAYRAGAREGTGLRGLNHR